MNLLNAHTCATMRAIAAISMFAVPGISSAGDDERDKVRVPIAPLAIFQIFAVQNDMRLDGSSVTGTWIDDDRAHPGDQPADALNVSHIECYPSKKVCIESHAAVQNNQWLTVDTTLWDISEQTKAKITATTAGLCATNTLTINLSTKEVTDIRQNGGDGDWAACTAKMKLADGSSHSLYAPLDHPMIWKMVSGLDAMRMDIRFKH
jgi:hypothetical protein